MNQKFILLQEKKYYFYLYFIDQQEYLNRSITADIDIVRNDIRTKIIQSYNKNETSKYLNDLKRNLNYN